MKGPEALGLSTGAESEAESGAESGAEGVSGTGPPCQKKSELDTGLIT